MVSTINGDANVPFYKELANQGVKATDIPVVAFSVGEEELAGVDTKNLVGHLAAWNYFQSIKDKGNDEFIAKWKTFTKNPKRVTNDPMEAHVIGFDMWVKAVEKAKTIDPDKVIEALPGIEAPNLTGGTSKMLANHHITKPVFIGEIRADGQFDVVWQTKDLVPGAAWSPVPRKAPRIWLPIGSRRSAATSIPRLASAAALSADPALTGRPTLETGWNGVGNRCRSTVHSATCLRTRR